MFKKLIRKLKRKKWIIKIFLFVILLSILKIFWFTLTTSFYGYIYPSLSNKKALPKNSVIFFRNETSNDGDQHKTGIWMSDLDNGNEKLLFSYKDLYSKSFDKNLYRIDTNSPTISPDKKKIAFFIGLDYKNSNSSNIYDYQKYSLWVYDISTNRTTRLLENIYRIPGIAREPIWDSKSETVMIDIKKGNRNCLFLVNLFGFKKEIATGVKDKFYQGYVNDNTVFFDTQKTQNRHLGSTNLVTNWSRVYDLGLNTHYNSSNTSLVKDGFVTKAGGLGSEKMFENDEIHGLLKFNSKSNNIEKFKIFEDDYSRIGSNSLSAIKICGQWAFLIVNNSNIKDYKNTFLYNFETKKLNEIVNPEGMVYYPDCQLYKNRIVQITDNNVLNFDLSNPLPPKIFNYRKKIDDFIGTYEKSGLDIFLFDLQDNLLFVEVGHGFGSYNADVKKMGLYMINLDKQKIEQVSFPTSTNVSDIFLYYYD